MKNKYFLQILFTFFILFSYRHTFSQTSITNYHKSTFKVADITDHKDDTLRKQFKAKGLDWPAKYIYIRSFKFERQLEIWAKNSFNEPFKLFKTYKVCMQSGTMGPKRLQGDFQVPEGIYHINEFNPNSNYHLSMGLNYPNTSDRILSDSLRPGGDIYIHGSCVSIGCIPLTDDEIEEVYLIASYAFGNGQEFIPVHVFPIRYNLKKSVEYLSTAVKNKDNLKKFEYQLKEIYEYFNEHKQLPIVMVNKKGEYVLN